MQKSESKTVRKLAIAFKLVWTAWVSFSNDNQIINVFQVKLPFQNKRFSKKVYSEICWCFSEALEKLLVKRQTTVTIEEVRGVPPGRNYS